MRLGRAAFARSGRGNVRAIAAGLPGRASVVQDDLYSVTGRGVLEAHELVGIRLSEAALFDADGKIVGIKNFSPKFKESDERYEISIKLRF